MEKKPFCTMTVALGLMLMTLVAHPGKVQARTQIYVGFNGGGYPGPEVVYVQPARPYPPPRYYGWTRPVPPPPRYVAPYPRYYPPPPPYYRHHHRHHPNYGRMYGRW